MTVENVSGQLALQSALRRHLGRVVHHAERDAARLDGAGMDKSQLQNVLNVAEESRSVPVVANFIRYQIGRARVGAQWQHNNFGLTLVAQMLEPNGVVEREVEAILAELREAGYTLPEHAGQTLRYELMRHYLGYLTRAYVFGDSGVKGAWQMLRETPEPQDV